MPRLSLRGIVPELRIQGYCLDSSGRPPSQVWVRIGKRKIPCHPPYSARETFPPSWETLPDGAVFECRILAGPGLKALALEAEFESGETKVLRRRLQWAWRRRLRPFEGRNYREWINRFFPEDRKGLRQRLSAIRERRRFSILVPVYNPEPASLEAAIESVERQDYPDWQLCLADDASTRPEVRRILKQAATRDERIQPIFREVNGHISAASNSALNQARGDYVALLDHDDLLAWNALGEMALALDRNPSWRWVYSDEDKVTEKSLRDGPYLKPAWNPDLLRSQNYICHLSVMDRRLVLEAGGFREGFEGSQDWDLFLRLASLVKEGEVGHVPRILYHWRMSPDSTALNLGVKDYAREAALRALEEDARRLGRRCRHEWVEGAYWRRVEEALPSQALAVGIGFDPRAALPSRIDGLDMNFQELPGDLPTRELAWTLLDGPADGTVIILLWRDFRPVSEDALRELVGQAARTDLGMVGGKVFSAAGTIDHAGMILGGPSVLRPAFFRSPPDRGGMGIRCRLAQNYSCLGGGVLSFRAKLLLQLRETPDWGTWDAMLADWALQWRAAGLWNLYTPFAECFLQGEGFRELPSRDRDQLSARWPNFIQDDPAFHPCLDFEKDELWLAAEPRLKVRAREVGCLDGGA